MNNAVSAFLSKHNFVRHVDVNTVAESILDDMNRGLRQEKSDEDMIPTWCLPPSKKVSEKSVIVIDAGGTNFRSCLVTFDINGVPSISDMEKTKMPGVEKELSKKEFFDCFAKNLEHLKNKADSIGFCFSYPMQITDNGDGILLGFSKEVKAPEVVGCKVGECLKDALEEHGWKRPSKVTMLNDTVAALLAGAAAAKQGRLYSSYIGLILGTGMNAAYIQPELSFRKGFKKQIVVCEAGKIRCVNRSDFDIEFDKTTQKPGEFYMEKLCSGAYLGPQTLFMLKGAAQEGLFSESLASKLLSLNELTTIEISDFLAAPYSECTLAKLCSDANAGEEDMNRLYQLLDAVVERSARYAAAILVADVIQCGEGKNASKPVCILCNGSTFYKTHMIYKRVCAYLERSLTIERGLYWEIVSLENDITFGTAIAGLID